MMQSWLVIENSNVKKIANKNVSARSGFLPLAVLSAFAAWPDPGLQLSTSTLRSQLNNDARPGTELQHRIEDQASGIEHLLTTYHSPTMPGPFPNCYIEDHTTGCRPGPRPLHHISRIEGHHTSRHPGTGLKRKAYQPRCRFNTWLSPELLRLSTSSHLSQPTLLAAGTRKSCPLRKSVFGLISKKC